jgi:hypothetical protein
MLLPFGSSFGSSITNIHGSPLYSGHKYLVPIMQTYSVQTTLLSIYTPVTDLGDQVMMHPSDPNIAYASKLKPAAGNMGVEYVSLSNIIANAPVLKSKGVTFISYDLEANLSPSSDLIDPVASVQTAAAITHQYGLKFMADPSNLLTNKYYSSFADVSDLYNLQAQALESDPSAYSAYVHQIVPKLKNAHPGMPVSVQTSTERGSLSQMKRCFSLVADVADGSTSWYANDIDSLTALNQYLTWFVINYG